MKLRDPSLRPSSHAGSRRGRAGRAGPGTPQVPGECRNCRAAAGKAGTPGHRRAGSAYAGAKGSDVPANRTGRSLQAAGPAHARHRSDVAGVHRPRAGASGSRSRPQSSCCAGGLSRRTQPHDPPGSAASRTGQAPGAASGSLRWIIGDVMLYLHGEPRQRRASESAEASAVTGKA